MEQPTKSNNRDSYKVLYVIIVCAILGITYTVNNAIDSVERAYMKKAQIMEKCGSK